MVVEERMVRFTKMAQARILAQAIRDGRLKESDLNPGVSKHL
jgi:hypothetical protein